MPGSDLGGVVMRHQWTKNITLALAMMSPLAACLDDEAVGPEDGTASLSIYLTDARGDVANVWVELLGLTAQGGEGGPVELLEGPTELVLLTELVGTLHLLQANTEFDPTNISQLRMVIGDVVLQVEDEGEVVYVKSDDDLDLGLLGFTDPWIGDLQCPSCSQNGIKVKVPSDGLDVAGDVAIVLDFDVTQSFGHRAGNSGKWVMHPVIQGTLVEAESLNLPNSISGIVHADDVLFPTCNLAGPRTITDFIPTATSNELKDDQGKSLVWTGSVREDGTYSINLLPRGTYTMGYVSPFALGNDENLTFDVSSVPANVTLENEAVKDADYTLIGVDCL